MKKGFSALEILIVLAVLLACFFIFKGAAPVKFVINEHKEIKTKQEYVNHQLDELQKAKNLRDERLKQDFERSY